MPNIDTYTAKQAAPQASSAGSEAFEIEGRHIEGAYAQAGSALGGGIKAIGNDINQHMEIQETSSVSAQGAKAFADLSKDLSSTMSTTDPNNADEAADKWREGMEEKIGAIGDGMSTRAGMEAASRVQNTLRNEFTTQSRAYQSTLSGQAIISNLTQTKNGLAQAVSNNPASLPAAIDYLHGAMQDQLATHSYLAPGEVARVQSEFTDQAKKDLGIAAFTTMAQSNPAAAKEALKTGTFAGLFGGQEIDTLNKYADMQAKAAVEANTAAANAQRRADSDAFKQTTSQMISTTIRPDGSLVIPKDLPQAIIKASLMPGAEMGTVKSMIDMVKQVNKDNANGVKIVSDPATYQMFSTKMLSGELTDADVYAARADKQLSDKDTSYFIRASKDLAADPAKKEAEKQFNAWVSSQKPAFTKAGLFGVSDPVGMQKYNQFMQAAHTQFEQTYSSKGDWQGMLNAKNDAYLGKLAPQYMQNVKGASIPAPIHVNTVEDAAKLKVGTQFVDPNGVVRTR